MGVVLVVLVSLFMFGEGAVAPWEPFPEPSADVPSVVGHVGAEPAPVPALAPSAQPLSLPFSLSVLLLLITGWQYHRPWWASLSGAPHSKHLSWVLCLMCWRCFPTHPAPVPSCCRMFLWLGVWSLSVACRVAWSMLVAGIRWLLFLASVLNRAS